MRESPATDQSSDQCCARHARTSVQQQGDQRPRTCAGAWAGHYRATGSTCSSGWRLSVSGCCQARSRSHLLVVPAPDIVNRQRNLPPQQGWLCAATTWRLPGAALHCKTVASSRVVIGLRSARQRHRMCVADCSLRPHSESSRSAGHLFFGRRHPAAGGTRQQEAAGHRRSWHWQQCEWQRGAKWQSCRRRWRRRSWQGDYRDRRRLLPAAHSGGWGNADTGEKLRSPLLHCLDQPISCNVCQQGLTQCSAVTTRSAG
jgi:hypothetical protein